MSDAVAEAARLLLRAGKNVLLIGPPGTGKTTLAADLAEEFTGTDPVLVTGSGDLSSTDLLYRLTPGAGGGWKLELGGLAASVLASWARTAFMLPPRWVLLDELNRMNAETALGPLFSAVDLAARPRVPVVSGWLVRRVLEDKELLESVATLSGLQAEETRKGIMEALEAARGKGLDGLPLPLWWRSVATVNTVDRSHLFSLGFALLRRFPPLTVPGPLRRVEPRLGAPRRSGEALGRDEWREICRRAVRELTGPERVLLPEPPLLLAPEGLVDEVLGALERVFEALGFVVEGLSRVGVDIGYAQLVDSCKLAVAGYLERGGAAADLVADVAAASLLLPQLGAVAAAIKTEMLLQGSSARRARAQALLKRIWELFGEHSFSALYAEALSLELGVPLHD